MGCDHAQSRHTWIHQSRSHRRIWSVWSTPGRGQHGTPVRMRCSSPCCPPGHMCSRSTCNTTLDLAVQPWLLMCRQANDARAVHSKNGKAANCQEGLSVVDVQRCSTDKALCPPGTHIDAMTAMNDGHSHKDTIACQLVIFKDDNRHLTDILNGEGNRL